MLFGDYVPLSDNVRRACAMRRRPPDGHRGARPAALESRAGAGVRLQAGGGRAGGAGVPAHAQRCWSSSSACWSFGGCAGWRAESEAEFVRLVALSIRWTILPDRIPAAPVFQSLRAFGDLLCACAGPAALKFELSTAIRAWYCPHKYRNQNAPPGLQGRMRIARGALRAAASRVAARAWRVFRLSRCVCAAVPMHSFCSFHWSRYLPNPDD